MADYRNIDAILIDARTRVTIADSTQPVDWSDIPAISDDVSLDTDQGYPMMVEITEMSDDKNTFKGKVTHGYYTKTKTTDVEVGTMVEFSLKKIAGIHKSRQEKEFATFLTTNIMTRKKEIESSPKINWEAKKNEWLSDLDNLYKLFEKSLNGYVKRGLIKIDFDEVELAEENIGTYKAKRMLIDIADEKIKLEPIGTNVIAAKGRVDMTGETGASVKLVLVDSRMQGISDHIKMSSHVGDDKEKAPDTTPISWEWKFVTAPPTRKYQPVNEETVFTAIMDLSNAK